MFNNKDYLRIYIYVLFSNNEIGNSIINGSGDGT